MAKSLNSNENLDILSCGDILEAGCIFVGDLKAPGFHKVPTTLLGFLFYNVPETIQGYGLPGKKSGLNNNQLRDGHTPSLKFLWHTC